MPTPRGVEQYNAAARSVVQSSVTSAAVVVVPIPPALRRQRSYRAVLPDVAISKDEAQSWYGEGLHRKSNTLKGAARDAPVGWSASGVRAVAGYQRAQRSLAAA